MTVMEVTPAPAVRIIRPDQDASILVATGNDELAIRAGTEVDIDGHFHGFAVDRPVELGGLHPGCDYAIILDDSGTISVALAMPDPIANGAIAGFHYAPGGNARGKAGGDTAPAINPHSLWDIGFRPACADPRGMTCVDLHDRRFWADIYLLGVDHLPYGTSRCGATIANGRDLPDSPDGKGKARKLDYPTTVAIYGHHGKRLLAAEEFFAAAYGVEERCSLDDRPRTTGDLTGKAERFVSRHGLFGVTGTMWQWGTDGHPDDPRPSVFGGSWIDGSVAGSRYADLGVWPEVSVGALSARGACDHLPPV